MKVRQLGSGEPEHAVVCCIHGDESLGWKAVRRLVFSNHRVLRPVKLVLAHEEAYRTGERFIEEDLNRCFPGDEDSDVLEERLAAKLKSELEGMKILDIHSTSSEEAPFAITVGDSEELVKLAEKTGIENLIDMSYVEGGMGQVLEAVTVELSRKSDDPTSDAYEVLKNFLAAEGVIEAEFDRSDPELFKVYDTADGSGYEFVAENFRKVGEGEVFAESEDDVKKAEKDFYPVLMSTDGYDDMIGFKAEKVNVSDRY